MTVQARRRRGRSFIAWLSGSGDGMPISWWDAVNALCVNLLVQVFQLTKFGDAQGYEINAENDGAENQNGC